jgi:hypothetical protein
VIKGANKVEHHPWRRQSRALMRGFFSRIKRRLLVNSSRVHLERYNRDFAQTMKPGQRVLDAGAGDAPYRMLFNQQKYETADFEGSRNVTHRRLIFVTSASIFRSKIAGLTILSLIRPWNT